MNECTMNGCAHDMKVLLKCKWNSNSFKNKLWGSNTELELMSLIFWKAWVSYSTLSNSTYPNMNESSLPFKWLLLQYGCQLWTTPFTHARMTNHAPLLYIKISDKILLFSLPLFKLCLAPYHLKDKGKLLCVSLWSLTRCVPSLTFSPPCLTADFTPHQHHHQHWSHTSSIKS